MIALGNDVVDLSLLPRNGQAFYTKLGSYAFSEIERFKLASYLCTNEGIMLLWSIKEASYKSAMKLGFTNRFKPQDFAIRNVEMNQGFIYSRIEYLSNVFRGKSVFELNKIHTITIHEDYNFNEVTFSDEWITSTNYTDQHLAVRNLIVKDAFFESQGSISFSKNDSGIPFILGSGDRLAAEISFSHHGNLVGYGLKM